MSTHFCKYTHVYPTHMTTLINTHVYPTHMSTFERLSRLDLEIYEVGHQECIAVDDDVTSH
jgi:hypothetical protein